LLATTTTLAIGWQIYNSIELKAKIDELNVLKEKLSMQEKASEARTNQMNHLIFASLADVEISNQDYILAFCYLMTSLKYSMALDKPSNINTIFQRMDVTISRVLQDTSCPPDYMKKIQNANERIRGSKCYGIIKNQYEEKYNSFISKVKEAE